MNDSQKTVKRVGSVHPTKLPLPPHRQERAVATRRQLIAAARSVFAKNGFEHARIEEIAEKSGKTRGAFYANFEDKEDVFFAIFEEDLSSYQRTISPRLSAASTTAERIDAVTDHLVHVVRDAQLGLLYLEFKLYAIRHPRKRRRLSDLHAALCLRCCMTEVEDLLPELHTATPDEKRRTAAELACTLDGLTLNRLFAPESLSDEQVYRCLRRGVAETMRDQHPPEPIAAPPKPSRPSARFPARSTLVP